MHTHTFCSFLITLDKNFLLVILMVGYLYHGNSFLHCPHLRTSYGLVFYFCLKFMELCIILSLRAPLSLRSLKHCFTLRLGSREHVRLCPFPWDVSPTRHFWPKIYKVKAGCYLHVHSWALTLAWAPLMFLVWSYIVGKAMPSRYFDPRLLHGKA